MSKTLLIVMHTPSTNTTAMAEAIVAGAKEAALAGVKIVFKRPLETGAEDVLAADGIILGTTENLGYMSGALKDFFDRIYYPCLESKQGLPMAVVIRAGHDGTGTQRAIETIATGLKWRAVQAPLLCRGEFQAQFVEQCHDLGMGMAYGLEAGVF